MAIAHDAQSRNTAADTTTPPTGDFNWTHTPSGTPKGVVVMVVQEASAYGIAGVTYGGVPMSLVRSYVRTTTEAARVYIFFLGDNIPTGAQSVSVDTYTTADRVGYCSTVTADGGATVVDAFNGTDAGIIADPSLTLDYTDSLADWEAYYLIFTGAAAPVTTVQSGSTHQFGNDLGAASSMAARKSGTGGNSTTMGYTLASDDVLHCGVVIKEAVSFTLGGFTARYSLANAGSSATCTIPVPPGTAEGDKLAICIAADQAKTVNTPTDWTALGEFEAGTGVSLWVFHRTAPASPPDTYDVTISASADTWCGMMIAIDGAGAFDVSATSETSGGTSLSSGSLTSPDSGDIMAIFWGARSDSAGVPYPTLPASGWTATNYVVSTNGFGFEATLAASLKVDGTDTPSVSWPAAVEGGAVTISFNTGTPNVNGAMSFTADGALTVASRVDVKAASSWTADSSLSTAAMLNVLAALPVTADGSLTVSSLLTIPSVLPLTADSLLTISGTRVVSGALPFTAESEFTISAQTAIMAALSATAESQLTIASLVNVLAAIPVTADSLLTISGRQQILNALAVSGDGVLGVSSRLSTFAVVPFTAESNFFVNGDVEGFQSGRIDFSAESNLSIASRLNISSALAVVGDGQLVVTGNRVAIAALVLSGESLMSLAAEVSRLAAINWTAEGVLSVRWFENTVLPPVILIIRPPVNTPELVTDGVILIIQDPP